MVLMVGIWTVREVILFGLLEASWMTVEGTATRCQRLLLGCSVNLGGVEVDSGSARIDFRVEMN